MAPSEASFGEVLTAIQALRHERARVIVGISGFGGSGKSTLARALIDSIPDSVRMRGDDFLDPVRSHHRSADWDGVERMRLREEVLDPFRASRASTFRRFDWAAGALADPEPLPDAEVLIVDCIGIFHPELDDAFDLKIWVDVELHAATERGKVRDRAHDHDHDQLWDEVWMPNDRDFFERFHPGLAADLTVRGSAPTAG